MKKPLFYFLLALTAVVATTGADWQPVPVLDIEGNKVLGGRSYYLIPTVPGKGGGLGLASRGDKKCPLDIVQESSDDNDGITVKFSEWLNHVGYVPERENLKIEMDTADKTCCEQTYWSVSNRMDEETKQWFVSAGPKSKWTTNSFDLIKSGEGYKFVWCPTFDLTGTNNKLYDWNCKDIGIFVDENGVRRLAFSDEPLVFKFKKFVMPPTLSSKTI